MIRKVVNHDDRDPRFYFQKQTKHPKVVQVLN